jgi:hypothetical protein
MKVALGGGNVHQKRMPLAADPNVVRDPRAPSYDACTEMYAIRKFYGVLLSLSLFKIVFIWQNT